MTLNQRAILSPLQRSPDKARHTGDGRRCLDVSRAQTQWHASCIAGDVKSHESESAERLYAEGVALFERGVAIFVHASRTYWSGAADRALDHYQGTEFSVAARDHNEEEALPLGGPPTPSPAEPIAQTAIDAGRRPSLACILTPRQLEIARLIARGSTNAEIAEKLVVTRGTAANHVAQILNRLGLKSRTQVAVWAIQHGLIADAESSLFG